MSPVGGIAATQEQGTQRLAGGGCCSGCGGAALRQQQGYNHTASGLAPSAPAACLAFHLPLNSLTSLLPLPPFCPCPSTLNRYRDSTQGFGWYDWLGWFLPCFVWLRQYNWREWLLVRIERARGAAARGSGCMLPRLHAADAAAYPTAC